MVKINEYKTYEGSDCFLGCIQNYLLLYQNLVDECNIFFEGNGFDLTYILNEDDKYSIKFKAHINESVYKYCDKYGVKLQKKKFKDIKVADKELLEDLKKNHIVIKLNAENLKYNDVFKYSFSVTHYINLLSYDFNKNRAYISDGFIPKYPREIYQGWYNYKDLRYAREKVEYEYIVVEKDSLQDIYEKLNKCEVNKRLYNCVIDNIRRYIRGGKDKDAYHGIDAIEHFIDKISGLVVDDAEEFLYNNYKIPIPEYNSIAEYIFSKLNSVGVNVSDVLEKSILINNEDKCIVRRDLKKLAFNRFINKYKGCNINNSKYLLPILSVPNIDDEEFINFDSSGNLSVNNYGQIRFEDLNRKYITVFAHPNENKLEILSKYFYQNQIVDGIEINKRNRHCEKDKILKFVRSHNMFYTIGSDDHGDHLYTYEDINYYKLNSIEFKKILKLVMRREEL